ncbi:MAG: NADH-quinone oxidoreductase subunit NuoK [Bacillota bacterium]
MANYFLIDLIAVILMVCIGLYTLLLAKNLIRMLIGFEIMTKGVTLAIVSAGNANGRIALGQSLVITMIVVEVVSIAIALAIVMLIHKKKNSLNVRKLTNLKG